MENDLKLFNDFLKSTPNLSKKADPSFEILNHLELAFGGISQVPLKVIGQAVRGHVTNQGMENFQALKIIVEITERIVDRFQDLDFVDTENKILSGYEQ